MNRIRAMDYGLGGCHHCGLLLRVGEGARCPRCGSRVHLRRPDSIARTWALVIAAAFLYVPANTLPIMTAVQLGRGQPDTILSGVVFLLEHDMWPLALIVFVASVIVPLFKLISLSYLLISIQRGWGAGRRQRTWLFRMTELVGRWSMVDVFVIALLTALVQMGAIASVTPGAGAMAFAAVVVLTMLATMSFDPRLIWDRLETGADGED